MYKLTLYKCFGREVQFKTETVLHTHHYTHTSMAGEIAICQKSKPYLPNFSSEFRPVYAGGGGGGGGSRGFEQTPLLVDQLLFARIRKCTKKLIETSLHHKLCSIMGNEVCFFISRLHIRTGKVTVDKLPF